MSNRVHAPGQPHIVVRDLTMAFGSFVLMHDLNFVVNHGDVFIIMGGSGCGKSTLLRHLVGLIEPAKGEISYDGFNFTKAEPQQRAILELKDSLGTTIVVVTHELASIFTIGNNSVFLDPDTRTMIVQGDPKELRDHSSSDDGADRAGSTVRRLFGSTAPGGPYSILCVDA